MRIFRLIFALLAALALTVACGPGWDEYQDHYSPAGPVVTAPWSGPESVFIVLDDAQVEVLLEGMQTYDYQGALAVSLSDLVIQSGLTPNPESFRYDFTATDGYDLFIKRYEDISLLPSWQEMLKGYLYWDTRYDDLTAGWTEHPWGSALSAYQVKWMNGGLITLLPVE
ncbi:MAG TPA: hypothetical protein PKW95_21090 [bacterium]|nr:hypothetical protein [bacterium]